MIFLICIAQTAKCNNENGHKILAKYINISFIQLIQWKKYSMTGMSKLFFLVKNGQNIYAGNIFNKIF